MCMLSRQPKKKKEILYRALERLLSHVQLLPHLRIICAQSKLCSQETVVVDKSVYFPLSWTEKVGLTVAALGCPPLNKTQYAVSDTHTINYATVIRYGDKVLELWVKKGNMSLVFISCHNALLKLRCNACITRSIIRILKDVPECFASYHVSCVLSSLSF